MPFSNDGREGKLGIAELSGACSAQGCKGPAKLSRISSGLSDFCFRGRVNGRTCVFRIDTGSDVSVLREDLLGPLKSPTPVERYFLTYPTGETVPVKHRVVVGIEIGKFSLDFPVIIAAIKDECILGADFLSKIGVGSVFSSVFEETVSGSQENFFCSRICSFDRGIPFFLKEFFEKNSETLNASQKEQFAELVIEFQDVFFGGCGCRKLLRR